MFVDEARIVVRAGDGGKGCESFYEDKYTRYPRPDGGDGGRGGNVIFMADKSVRTLIDFRFNQHYSGERGGNASSKNKTGRVGKDCIIHIPAGTVLRDHATGLLIKDLVEDRQTVLVVRGGRGGRGNNKGKTPAPPGRGQELTVSLELKLIADCGIIGFPNAGKSTFISTVSRVKSKIANYPFTTKQPILGIVTVDDHDIVLADLPGIIEGAHEGRGLGVRFLRHAERTKVLIHMIDMAATEGRDPLEDYEKIQHELREYSDELYAKPRIVVANKMDVPEAAEHLKRFKKKYKNEKIFSISSAGNKGLKELLLSIKDMLCRENSKDR